MRMTDLRPGWAVVANDGRRLGTVREVGQNYVRTSGKGMSGDMYIPASAIANISDEVIQLNLASNEVQSMAWHQPPRADDTLETSPEPDLERHI